MRTLILLAGLFSTACFAQQKAESVVYLETIGNEFQGVSKEMMDYISAAAHGKGVKKVEKRRQELVVRIKEAERNIRKMRPFQNDVTLRDSVVAYFSISYNVFNQDYGKIVDLEEVAEQSYDLMEAYMLAKEKASEKMAEAQNRVNNQFDAFVAKHNVTVVTTQSKLGQKLEASAKVLKYHNQVYLIFFKSYKDEFFMMDALQRQDVNAKEQTRNALQKSSEEGLQKLKQISAFNDDASLKTACQQLLQFYKQEASVSVPVIIDFDLKRENFEKIKKAFDAKRQTDRTQADVDTYNKAIKDYNDAVNKVNVVSNDLNKKRTQLLDNWNKASAQFLDRHTPK